MNYFFALGIVCLGWIPLSAQDLTVKDKATLNPLELVTVYSKTTGASGLTDIRGRVNLSEFAGSDSLFFQLIGYKPLALSLEEIRYQDYVVLLSEQLLTLEEIVVAANRWEQDSREVPFRIAAVRAREIAFQNPQTAADLLGLSGEVFIQKSQLGGGSPVIRGFSTNRVLLVVDGVRMNNAIFRSGNLQNVISLDGGVIGSAEVIFGPSSVIYGSDAIGGVMDFHTLLPRLSSGQNTLFTGKAYARYASANSEKTGHFDLNFGGKKWALVSSITYSDFDDQRMGANGRSEYLRPEYIRRENGEDRIVANPDPEVQTPSGYDQINLMQKVRFRPSKSWDLNYGFHFSTTSDVPRYDRLVEYRGSELSSAQWYYGPQVWIMNNLNVQHQAEEGLYDRARLIVAHQFFEESRHDRRFGRDQIRHRTEKVDAFSANLDLDKQLSARSDLFYGLEWVYNRVGSTGEEENIATGNTGPLSTRYPDGSGWSSYAAYASFKSNLSDKVTFLAGARYNFVHLEATFDTTFFPFPFLSTSPDNGALTGSAGITYRPGEGWQFNVNTSTGFRAPNIDDVGKVFDSEPGNVVVPNSDLSPEYAYSADFGLIRTIGDFLRLDATVYYTYLDDALVRRDFLLDGRDSILYDGLPSRVQAIQNAAKAWVWGIQAGLEVRLPGNLLLTSRINYQTGKEEDEQSKELVPLRHAAPIFGATHLIYQRERLKADLYALYNGEVAFEDLAPSEREKVFIYATDSNGNPFSPSWYTLNFKASYQLSSLLQLSLGVENITDQRYRPYLSGIVAPGRNVIAAARVSF